MSKTTQTEADLKYFTVTEYAIHSRTYTILAPETSSPDDLVEAVLCGDPPPPSTWNLHQFLAGDVRYRCARLPPEETPSMLETLGAFFGDPEDDEALWEEE